MSAAIVLRLWNSVLLFLSLSTGLLATDWTPKLSIIFFKKTSQLKKNIYLLEESLPYLHHKDKYIYTFKSLVFIEDFLGRTDDGKLWMSQALCFMWKGGKCSILGSSPLWFFFFPFLEFYRTVAISQIWFFSLSLFWNGFPNIYRPSRT